MQFSEAAMARAVLTSHAKPVLYDGCLVANLKEKRIQSQQ